MIEVNRASHLPLTWTRGASTNNQVHMARLGQNFIHKGSLKGVIP
ncbi:Unannotated [Lentimonas sp. CC4]|nr:Unannotated [Lentimonas sp. CC4]CAA6686054.1 Unannotated [Lentimonas sp. CC6]CAA7077695.1 Unannotated [Lentimonas sp. CC4]CAA7168504.1 Unannotated [Lentimonas sp. CC21]CAA7183002.1 Unannotated [Lentimonas sp. CC8]